MPEPIVDLPLRDIDATALPRDRSAPDPVALAELRASVLKNGIRMPLEVFENLNPNAPAPYGLISGLRRLTVARELHAGGLAAFATVPARICAPASLPAALMRMVEENDIRAEIAPWDKARIALDCVYAGHFDTVDAAIEGLYPAADRQRRARLRAICTVAEEFGSALCDPHCLSQRQLLRLAAACRGGFTDLMLGALAEARCPDIAAQLKLPDTILLEAEAEARHPAPPDPRPGRPRRFIRPRDGLAIRRERTTHGWSLHFTGTEANGMLMESIMDAVERLVGR